MSKNESLVLTPDISTALIQLLQDKETLEAYMPKQAKPAPTLAELLSMDEKGHIKQTNENCQLVLQYDELLADAIKFNELTGQMDIVKEMPWKRFGTAFCDNDLDNIITYVEKNYGLKIDKLIERAIRVKAKENSYHPIRDLLNSLKWDGINRTSHVLTKYLGVAPTPLAIESLKVFMLGAIARVFTPGIKFEYMLCLVGGQGAGKSTFLRFLALQDMWFTDDIRKLSDKDIYEHLNGHWILEIPEMLAILHAQYVEETKSFISRLSDNYRIRYDRFAADHPRQCVFAGTSNRIEFLPPDKSGNRRFLPVEVDMENAEVHILENENESREYFLQLWAEVMEIYKAGNFKLTLSSDMQDSLRASQKKYMPEDPMETAILNYIEEKQPKYVCTKLLFCEALGHLSSDTLETWQSNAIGEIMNQSLKTEYRKISSHKFNDYGVQRAWVRIAEPKEHEFMTLTPEQEKELPFK